MMLKQQQHQLGRRRSSRLRGKRTRTEDITTQHGLRNEHENQVVDVSNDDINSKEQQEMVGTGDESSLLNERARRLLHRRCEARKLTISKYDNEMTVRNDGDDDDKNDNDIDGASNDSHQAEAVDHEKNMDDFEGVSVKPEVKVIDVMRNYEFDGVYYATYGEMVQAKRMRNEQFLLKSGLLTAMPKSGALAHARGITASTPGSKHSNKRRQSLGAASNHSDATGNTAEPRRKSKRLSGEKAEPVFVQDERAGRFVIGGESSNNDANIKFATTVSPEQDGNRYRDRMFSGKDMSLVDTVQAIGLKWLHEDSSALAQSLFTRTLQSQNKIASWMGSCRDALDTDNLDSQSSLHSNITSLSVDNDECVAKVVPERIYGMAMHPSMHTILVAAGDKAGHVGLWHVDADAPSSSTRISKDETSPAKSQNDGVHLFRYHTGAVNSLEWTPSGSALMSCSYDGTVRWFDIETQTSQHAFATYDDNDQAWYASSPGAGLEQQGDAYYTHYGCLDQHRFLNERCMFLCTSIGTVMHLDLRAHHDRITLHAQCSERKINTLSQHASGNLLASAGLDGMVKLWDLRKMGQSTSKCQLKPAAPVASYSCGKSINSAMFSPTGQYMVTVTQGHRLELLHNFHLLTSSSSSPSPSPSSRSPKLATRKLEPRWSVYHDNQTGRWLSTFRAVFHPVLDSLICVGSMNRPRAMEIWDADGTLIRSVSGDAMTAVASRCVFHRSTERIYLAGGNSSGRVTIVR